MNKLAKTTFAATFVVALGIAATVHANNTTAPANGSTSATNGQALNQSAPAAGTKHHHHHLHHAAAAAAPVDTNPGYTEMRIGDPRIVYSEIGTAGAQRGNTIVPFYDEPIRSSKPYEIRYDYAEFKSPAPEQHKHWSW